MGQFSASLFREVTTQDRYTIEVEAESAEHAQRLAEGECSLMDHDCPDGVTESGYVECGGWQVGRVDEGAMDPDVAARQAPGAAAQPDPVALPGSLASLPDEVLRGLLDAAEAGMPRLGLSRTDAIAGVAVLRLHVSNLQQAAARAA